MANELTIENASYEQLIKSNTAQALATELHLNESQIAKANTSLLSLLDDPKLAGASQISKMRFAYRVATLNYKNSNAIAPVKYGNSVQAQLQYQAYIEDMIECGGVKEANALALYKGVDYKGFINAWGFKELVLPERIELKDIFETKEIIGYYAYAICNDGRVATCLMSKKEMEDWAMKYSISHKAFKSGKAQSSIWNDNELAMSLKTCIKVVARQVLKWYPYDRLNKSLVLDQAVFTDKGETYLDNEKPQQSLTNQIVVDSESGEIKATN